MMKAFTLGKRLLYLLSFFLIPALLSRADGQPFPVIRHTYPKIEAPARNPLKGWNDGWISWSGTPETPASVSFNYIPWKSFQTAQGVFDWSAVESQLAKPGVKGRHFVLRVYPQWDGTEATPSETTTPDYLFSTMGVRFITGTNQQNQIRHVVDCNDSNYLKEAAVMIQALAARYDNDPRIYAVELGVLGFWGEGHTFGIYTNNVMLGILPSSMSNILSAYQTWFKKKKLMARQVENPVYQDAQNIGFHNDYFRAYSQHDSNFTLSILKGGFWRKGPIGGETPPLDGDPSSWLYNPTIGGSFLGLDMVNSGHYATMLHHGYGRSPGDPNYAEYVTLGKRMGYNYQLSEALFSKTNYSGMPLLVSVKGTNVGIAPMYYNWDVEYALLDGANKPVTRSLVPVALTSVMDKDAFQLNASIPIAVTLPGGTYKLGLRIVQPGASASKAQPWALYSSNVAIQFANSFPLGYIAPSWSPSNSLDGGWSILGNVTVISNAKLIVSGFPPSMTTNQNFSFTASVSGNFGYVSTNPSGPFSAFGISGTNIAVSATATYWYFASNAIAGSSATNACTYIVDKAAPIVTGFKASFTTNAPFFFDVAVNESFGYYSIGIGGGFFSIPTNGIRLYVSNDTTFRYFTMDSAGNRSLTNVVTYIVDTEAPTVWAEPAIWGTTNTPFFMNFTTSENFGYLSTNSATGPWIKYSTSGTNIWISKSGAIWFYGRDAYGNQTSTNTRYVVFDTNTPVVTGFLSSRTTNSPFTMFVDVNEPAGFVSTNLAGPFASFSTNGTNIAVTKTTTFYFFARDAAGNNSGIRSVTYTFDTKPPVILFSPTNTTTNSSFNLSLRVDENTGYLATNATGPFWGFTTNGTNINVTRSTTFWYYGRDSLGNTSPLKSNTYTILSGSAPMVGGFPSSFSTNTVFNFTATVTGNFGYFATNVAGPFTPFSTNGTNLSVLRTTPFWFFGRDASGNTSSTNSRTYTFDTTAPTVTGFPASFTTNSGFIFFADVNENSGYIATNAGGPFQSFSTNGTNISVTGTTAFWYYGKDAAGNTSATNTRTYILDVTPPIVGARASLTTNRSFTNLLTTTENSGYWSTNGSTFVSFSTNGTNLVIGSTTTLRVYGRDTLGNVSATNQYFYRFDFVAPVVSAMSNLVTNAPFTNMLASSENDGFWSTNGSAFTRYSSNGYALFIGGDTTLKIYGLDSAGNRSATNTYVYRFTNAGIAPIATVIPASMVTNKSFSASITASVGGGYWSTNGGVNWIVFSSSGTNVWVAGARSLMVYATNGNLVSTTNQVTYDWDDVAPIVTAPASFSTNQAFTLKITVNENNGWWSTNSPSGPFTSMSVAGTNLQINETCTLWFYGRDVLGNTSTTNARTYIIQQAMLAQKNQIAALSPEYAFLSGENLRVALTIERGATDYRLEIRHLDGQKIKTFSSREIDASQGNVVWNGAWENGAYKTGIYFLDLVMNGHLVDRRKIIIVRGKVGY